jgi:hypothetical protein
VLATPEFLGIEFVKVEVFNSLLHPQQNGIAHVVLLFLQKSLLKVLRHVPDVASIGLGSVVAFFEVNIKGAIFEKHEELVCVLAQLEGLKPLNMNDSLFLVRSSDPVHGTRRVKLVNLSVHHHERVKQKHLTFLATHQELELAPSLLLDHLLSVLVELLHHFGLR